MLTSKQMDSIRSAIVKVGAARGFIIAPRREFPPFSGKGVFVSDRLVVTAAHCLPRLPLPASNSRPSSIATDLEVPPGVSSAIPTLGRVQKGPGHRRRNKE